MDAHPKPEQAKIPLISGNRMLLELIGSLYMIFFPTKHAFKWEGAHQRGG